MIFQEGEPPFNPAEGEEGIEEQAESPAVESGQETVEEQEEKPFEITKETENGLWLNKELTDDQGRAVGEEIRKFKDSENPQEGDELEYHFRKDYQLDEAGNKEIETGESFAGRESETKWAKDYTYDKQGRLSLEVGENVGGKSSGHRWRKKYTYDQGGNVSEQGEILTQGSDLDKPVEGHNWTHDHRSSY